MNEKSPQATTRDFQRGHFYRGVGSRIKQVRESKNLSQQTIAESVGLSRTSLTNIEKGRQKMLLHTFSEIASALGVSANELFPMPSSTFDLLDVKLPSKMPQHQREFVENALKAPVYHDSTPTKNNSTQSAGLAAGQRHNRAASKR